MKYLSVLFLLGSTWCLGTVLPTSSRAADSDPVALEAIVARTIRPLMEHEGIPGMAVGVVCDGRPAVFEYGIASRATGKPVTADTLFEVGSVTKTFTGTLASYAQVTGCLSLGDPASKYLPALHGSHFDRISVLNLATHTAGDLLRFVEANLGTLALDGKWQQAITATHTGYYRVGGMTQDLVWEQYPYPADLEILLAGNSDDVILHAQPAVAINPPLPPQADVLINKTGSTNGFGAYVAFVPARKLGVVLLANKRYPIPARVTAAHEILSQLAEHASDR